MKKYLDMSFILFYFVSLNHQTRGRVYRTQTTMKKLLVLSVVLMSLVSCEKESLDLPIVACKCNDGTIQPGSNASACGNYVLTTNGISVTLNRGGVKEYIRSNKSFCELYPNHIFCLGQGY